MDPNEEVVEIALPLEGKPAIETVAPVVHLVQTASSGSPNLVGTDNPDKLVGDAGSNRLEGGASEDILDGGAGLDVAVYSGARCDFTVALGDTQAPVTVTTGNDRDTLIGIERIAFADMSLAFDFANGGAAGKAAHFVYDVFGVAGFGNLGLVGLAVNMFDKGYGEVEAFAAIVAANVIAEPNAWIPNQAEATYPSFDEVLVGLAASGLAYIPVAGGI